MNYYDRKNERTLQLFRLLLPAAILIMLLCLLFGCSPQRSTRVAPHTCDYVSAKCGNCPYTCRICQKPETWN